MRLGGPGEEVLRDPVAAGLGCGLGGAGLRGHGTDAADDLVRGVLPGEIGFVTGAGGSRHFQIGRRVDDEGFDAVGVGAGWRVVREEQAGDAVQHDGRQGVDVARNWRDGEGLGFDESDAVALGLCGDEEEVAVEEEIFKARAVRWIVEIEDAVKGDNVG